MKNILLFFLSISLLACNAQQHSKIYISYTDPHDLYVNDGDSTRLFYYKILPEGKPKGVLVILPSGGETVESAKDQLSLDDAAVEDGFIVVIPSLNWGTIDRLPENELLNTIFEQVVKSEKVDKTDFFLCGFSNGGMIALQYAIRAGREDDTFLVPRGIIGLDPPLDFARMYRYAEREIARNFSPAGVAEARWLRDMYDGFFGGSPDQFPAAYQNISIYTHGAEGGGNAKYLGDTAIRMLSDLNTTFLINERHRDLHDWNGTDIVAFINQLKINEHPNAEVIISLNKGIRPDGSVHPHSWSVMDTEPTLRWMNGLLSD